MTQFDVLIVGAGHGGAQAAILLRQLGFAGTVGLIGAEPELPYERPPLSKDYLAGEKSFERMLIRPAAFWAERDIHMVAATRLTRLDPRRKEATSDNGILFGYGRLIWATGARRGGSPARAPTSRVCIPSVAAPMWTRSGQSSAPADGLR